MERVFARKCVEVGYKVRMNVFLGLKQIVDMFYQWQFLDYGMVLFALCLIVFYSLKNKKYLQFKERVIWVDYIVFGLMVVYSISFVRNLSFYGTFFKVESAFLLYFLGRIYGKKLFTHGRILAIISYLIVYSNFIYRFIEFGCRFTVGIGEEGLLNSGAFYYYKTDLAVALLLSIIFIYFFGKVTILKWFTIFPVVGYMIFYSGARMEMAVLLVIYLVILLHALLSRFQKQYILGKKTRIIIYVLLSVLVIGLFIGIQWLPYESYEFKVVDENGNATILEKIFHSRHVIWWNILHYFSDQSIVTRLFGIDLGSECMHSIVGDRAHSLYVKQIYAIGYVGCLSMTLFVASILAKVGRCVERRNAYMVLCLWVMFLLTGVSIESIELTQMSWFPMIFAGALLSGADAEGETTGK